MKWLYERGNHVTYIFSTFSCRSRYLYFYIVERFATSKCKRGYYGSNCGKRCSPYCEGGHCDAATGNCSPCKGGRTGPTCCIPCRYGCRQCIISDSSTNQTSCMKCKPQYYLMNGICKPCQNNCAICQNETFCHICVAGFFRRSVENGTCSKCPVNCKHCESLRECTECNEGWYGQNGTCTKCPVNCENCQNAKHCSKCKKGWYGNLCQARCPLKCHNRQCFQDGHCYLYVNLLTENGIQNSSNLNVENYNRQINRCNSSMLNCKFCHADYKDPCRECTKGWYGYLCNAKCSNNCDTTLGCHRDTGYCLRLDNPNPGPGKMLDVIMACDISMVNCKVCHRGQIDCDECKTGWFGNSCYKKCPTSCEYTLGCTKQNGSCFRGDGESLEVSSLKKITRSDIR